MKSKLKPKEKVNSGNVNQDLSREERLQRARNKIRLIRRTIDQTKKNQLKTRDLVRTYIQQDPNVAVKVIQRWLYKP